MCVCVYGYVRVCVPIYDKYTYSAADKLNNTSGEQNKAPATGRGRENGPMVRRPRVPGKFVCRARVRLSPTPGPWPVELAIFAVPFTKNSRLPGRHADNALITRRYLLLRLGAPLRHPQTLSHQPVALLLHLICHWALVVPFRCSSPVSQILFHTLSDFPDFHLVDIFHVQHTVRKWRSAMPMSKNK